MSELARTKEGRDISNDSVLASLQTVLSSKTFSHSASLRQALDFIVKKSISSPLEPIKEYTLATEVLGRSVNFDPKADNIVRVQMHRLREKLEEYYLAEGQRDLVRIVIPRGQYTTEYLKVTPDVQPAMQPPSADSPLPVAVSPVNKRGVDWRWAVGIAVVICGLILGANLLRPSTRLSSPFRSVWEPFLVPGSPPLIVYANPTFVIDKQGNFYRYDSPTILSRPMGSRIPAPDNEEVHPARKDDKGPYYYFDAFSGSGEVVAAARIAEFLAAHGEPFLIKRSHLISYGNINEDNVIFLGSGKMDQLIQKLPVAQELVFEPPAPDQYPIGSHIRDMAPPPGHPATYGLQLDSATGAIQADYALVSLLPGVSGEHCVLVLAGLTTLGTETAAEFIVSERNMALLEQMVVNATAAKSRPPFFQALLEVEVRDGVPLDVKCLLVRTVNYRAH